MKRLKTDAKVNNKDLQKYTDMRATNEICKGVVYYKGWAMITNLGSYYAKYVGEESYAEDELEGFIQFKDGRSIPAEPGKLKRMDIWHQYPEKTDWTHCDPGVDVKWWSHDVKPINVEQLKRYEKLFGFNNDFTYRLKNDTCYRATQLIQFLDICKEMGLREFAQIIWGCTPALISKDDTHFAICLSFLPQEGYVNIYNNETGEFEDKRYTLVEAHHHWSHKVETAKSEGALTKASQYIEEIEQLIEKWKDKEQYERLYGDSKKD